MDTIRDKIENTMWDELNDGNNGPSINAAIDAIMSIIKNHIEWSDPDDCQYGHVYSACGWYEIDSDFTLYGDGAFGEHKTLDEAKQAAQAHKEARG